MKFNVVQVVGLNTDQKAAQVISSSQDGDNTFLAVLDLSSDDAFTRGRQFLTEISDFYFDFEGSPSEKLKAAYGQAGEKFAKEDLPAGRQEFSLLIGSISGKVLFFIAKGEVEIYLKRGDKLSSLLTVGANEQLISGFLQPDDKLLFATKSLINFLDADLKKSLNLPLESFEEEITDRIGAANAENKSLAGLAVAVEDQASKVQTEQITDNPVVSYSLKFPKINLLTYVKIIKDYFPKDNRNRLIIALILILIIGLGVGFKIKLSKDAQNLVAFNQVLQKSRDDFNAAKGLASLNPSEAKAKLDSAKNELNRALNLRPKDSEALNFKKQIEQESDSILQQSSVSDFPLFLDTDLIKKNFRAARMSLSAGKLLLLDPISKTLIDIDLTKKSNQILAGSEKLGNAHLASLNGELAFVYSEDKGILRIDSTNQKIAVAVKQDEDLGKIADLYGFASNVYLLDPTGQIWKYIATNEGYSDKREYLTKNTKVDFANALKMQIESSIYILKNGGEILRFTRGVKDNFSYEGLDKGVKEPKSFFVSSDTDNLYVLDSGNLRLLILTKTGSYKGQMNGSVFATASDLAVDEKGKKVYLLDGSKIYSVDLK
ncbi:hypothetical protein A3C26_00605 [Candidatus Daviesbacteria bacterium RIFCSPHIGHO2_02_FULL_39_12]|uniref:Uncharacterized protein n=2 Tax=Candidatus Daviesiibacteriota TaxID=1752718 RepID=A0A1F5J9L8_9BACT|nr:MAG: hypothetical protein A3C26_00605 [Candidatus Daviesbacteria bacterium RIFCSPHIGHO2_02_FULL_39_12]OGE72506.1 MAG: hypothetical protein A3H40_00185 [Candidatus Daviesbacteria bacterium RIFCSPLOWO2_02_FULL_38_15]